VPFLKTLRLSAVFSSPFLRALETVRPYCDITGVDPIEREDLRESEEGEPISQVRERLWGAITSIVDSHPKGNLLVCTHGGCAWSIISHFDPTFDFQDYKQIRTPDMRKIIFDSKEPTLDQSFKFNALLSCKRPLR